MVRFILIIIVFAISLLTLFPAPTYHLWILSILVTEFPYIFIIVTLILLVIRARLIWYWGAGNILGLISLILFLTPVFRAYRVARKLPQQITAALGPRAADLTAEHLVQPYSFFSMFSEIHGDAVPHQQFVYADYPQKKLRLNFFSVKNGQRKPCVIVVHGGSWAGGDDDQLPELNSYLARRGYQVASINYRMAPQYKSPAPIEDLQNAIRFLKLHAQELQIDTNNFVLLGRSAGAQIALMAAYTLKNEGIKGVIDYYGPADMIFGYLAPSNPLVLDSHKVLVDYIGGTYQEVPQKYATSSPVLHVDAATVPTLIIHGKNDPLVSYQHSVRLNAKLSRLGVKHYFLSLPWATHGCDYSLNGPSGQLATYTVERFLHVITTSGQ